MRVRVLALVAADGGRRYSVAERVRRLPSAATACWRIVRSMKCPS